MNYKDVLSKQFNNRIKFVEKRPGISQLLAPLYYEDGDMLDVYIKEINGSSFQVCDFGMSIMKLSYEYELNSENKLRIFNQILKDNLVENENGNLYINTGIEGLFGSIMQFSQCIAKISNMAYFKREVIKSMFYEMLDEEIDTHYSDKYKKRYYPIPEHDEFEVDYFFEGKTRPVYLYGVKDNTKAKLVTISNQQFMLKDLPFTSFVVYEDFDNISKKDRNRILSATSKQFPSLEDFMSNGEAFLKQELVGL
jgi:hypothetical protein